MGFGLFHERKTISVLFPIFLEIFTEKVTFQELDRVQKDYDILVGEQNERENFLAKREKELASLKKVFG